MRNFNIFSKALRFVGEVKAEGKRVTWPTRRETMMTALSVFILAAIAAVFFVIVDSTIHTVLKYFHVVG